MKRVLAWLLLLTLVLGTFAGCKTAEVETTKPQANTPVATEPSETTPSGVNGPSAQNAMDYVQSLYMDGGSQTPVDYKRYGIVRVGGIEFKIEWTVDVGEDLVKVVPNEDGTVTIDINEMCQEDTPYVLTATITDAAGNTATHSWNYILPKAQDMVEIVKNAYALKPGESLPYESRLIGKIKTIDAIWSDEYQNITVTIVVEGAEDMPIKCYRMKANETTLEQIKDLKVGNIITVLGTLKNYDGTIEFDAGCILEKVEKGDAIDAPTDPGEILKAAYALKENEALPYQATLTGTVTAIDAPYDPNYGNISVVITVEGYEKYPMLCYRLKGTGVDEIAIDDLITVTGIIKNYKGTIEYDAGCIMTERVSGGGVAQKPSSDAAKILADAAKLGVGEKLPYRATLTGVISSVDNAYDPGYGNVTVTIKVNGVKIQCYRMVGDGIDQIRETDTITVTGVIENYNGKLEFGAKCTLDAWSKGPRNVNYGYVQEDVAYKLYMNQGSIDKTLYFNGQVSGSRLSTTDSGSKGVDVYAERHGKGLRFYYLSGNTKNYIEIEEYTNDKGQQRGRALVTTNPSCYWVYDSDTGVYIVNLPTAGKYFLGTYSTYETITASWIGYIDGSQSGSAQYVSKFIKSSEVPSDGPVDGATGVVVSDPQVGVAYKWGINQKNLGSVLYFSGTMSGYYGATVESFSKGVDVMLEEAPNGGYYVTFKDASGAKKYINAVVSGTHRNFTIANSPESVFTYNAEYNTLVTDLEGTTCYVGTYGTYNTFSISTFDKISSSFPAQFYVEGEPGDVPVDPSEPTEPSEPENVYVEEGVAYKLYMVQSGIGKTLYFNGSISGNRMQTTTVGTEGADVYAELDGSKIRFYFMDGNTKTYIEIEEYTNDKGQQRGQVKFTTTPSCYWTYDEANDVYVVTLPTAGNYFLGTYNTYDTITASWIGYIDGTYSGSTQYVAKFIKSSDVTDEPTEPSEPTQPSEPSVPEIPDDLEYIAAVIWSGEHNLAMKALDETQNYGYMKGTAVTVDGEMLTGFDENNIFVLVKMPDTEYWVIGDIHGRVLYMTGNFNSVNVTTEEPEDGYLWTITPAGDEYTYYITNVTTGKAFGYDPSYGSFGVYPDEAKWTPLYVSPVIIEEDPEDPTEPTQPTEPDVTVPPVTGDGYTKVTSADQFTSGEYVMIVSTGYAPGVFDNGWLSAEQPVVSGNTVTDTKGAVWTITVNGDSVTLTDSNGVTIKPKGGENNGVLEGDYEWTWSFENGTFRFQGVGADTVSLASNATTTGQYPGNHRFRGYKNKTITSQPNNYPCDFTLYKLGGEYVEPEVTEPEATEPSTPSEPITGEGVEVGKTYKWAIDQENKGVTLYFAGTMNGYYGATTEDIDAAVDVVLEAADGGYYVSFTDASGAKKYINVVVSGTHRNFTIADAPASVYTYSAEHNTLLTDVEGTTCYIGTYGTYNTFSVSPIDKISTSFPSYFVGVGGNVDPEPSEPETTEPAPSEPSVSEGVEIGKAYKWAIDQENKGVTLYFAGTMNGYYGATTEDINAAVDVILEAADGGYYVTFIDASGAKKYINVVVSGTHKNFTIATAPTSVYTYDAEYNTLLTDVNGTTCYIGTYGTYNTFSVSPIDKISTSFPSYFVGVGGDVEPEPSEPETTEPSAPSEPSVSEGVEIGKAYKWAIDQKNKGVILYFAGTMNGYYGATTEDINAAVDVILEAADAGYYVTFIDASGAKKYINVVVSGTHRNFTIANAPASVYTYDAEYNTLLTDVDGTTCYIGTYGTYNTFSVSPIDKIGTSFPSYFVGVGGESGEPDASEPEATEPEATEPEATEPSTGATTVKYLFSNYGPGTQYTTGENYELDAVTVMHLVGGHLNTQLRLYDDAKGDAIATFTCEKEITSVVINAGHRAASLEVYGSVDGKTWVLVETISTTTTATDYTVQLPAGCMYLKLDAVGAQIRVPYITFTFAN